MELLMVVIQLCMSHMNHNMTTSDGPSPMLIEARNQNAWLGHGPRIQTILLSTPTPGDPVPTAATMPSIIIYRVLLGR